jgi:hypothetical protein
MSERKWTQRFNRGCFVNNAEYVAYTGGFDEAIKASAAPDLYEALEFAREVLIHNGFFNAYASYVCDAALAKARGE